MQSFLIQIFLLWYNPPGYHLAPLCQHVVHVTWGERFSGLDKPCFLCLLWVSAMTGCDATPQKSLVFFWVSWGSLVAEASDYNVVCNICNHEEWWNCVWPSSLQSRKNKRRSHMHGFWPYAFALEQHGWLKVIRIMEAVVHFSNHSLLGVISDL